MITLLPGFSGLYIWSWFPILFRRSTSSFIVYIHDPFPPLISYYTLFLLSFSLEFVTGDLASNQCLLSHPIATHTHFFPLRPHRQRVYYNASLDFERLVPKEDIALPRSCRLTAVCAS